MKMVFTFGMGKWTETISSLQYFTSKWKIESMHAWMCVCVWVEVTMGKNVIMWCSNTHRNTHSHHSDEFSVYFETFHLNIYAICYLWFTIASNSLWMGAGVGMCLCKIHYKFRWKMLLWHWQTYTTSSVCVRQKSEMQQNFTILLDLRRFCGTATTHKYPYLHVCTENYKTTR